MAVHGNKRVSHLRAFLKKALIVIVVIAAGGAIAVALWPAKTNRVYLKDAMAHGMIQKAASGVAAQLQNRNALAAVTPDQRKAIAAKLTDCMQTKAAEYLSSSDSYLEQKVDDKTPQILAHNLLAACGALN